MVSGFFLLTTAFLSRRIDAEGRVKIKKKIALGMFCCMGQEKEGGKKEDRALTPPTGEQTSTR